MDDTPTQLDLSERPVPVADVLDVPPPRPRKARLLVALVAAVGLALLLAAPVTGRIADLVSLDRAEVVTEPPAVFPVEESSLPVGPSIFEELEAQIAELVERVEAQRRAAEAEVDEGAGTTTSSEASVSEGSARASSSSQVDVSQSVSGGGSASSSVSVSNSSSSSASSGGSVVVSGSSSSKVSSSQGGSASTSSCVSEVVTSTEVNGVAETSRQVSRSC